MTRGKLQVVPGNHLTGIALHFAIHSLLVPKQLQNIITENCDAIYPRLQAGGSV